jgi:hypothetical protein
MSITNTLIRVDTALQKIAQIDDPQVKDLVNEFIRATIDFYNEDPMRLASPLDLIFVVEVLKEAIPDLKQASRGEMLDFGEPELIRNTDIATDVDNWGMRGRQAHNYAIGLQDIALRDALLCVQQWARVKQSIKAKRSSLTGMVPIIPRHPEAPYDFLFVAMALNRALSPGQPIRRFFEQTT